MNTHAMKTRTARIVLYHVFGTYYHSWYVEYRGHVVARSSNDGEYLGCCSAAMVADATRAAYKLGYRKFTVRFDQSCDSHIR
jgi:hypothetical protein